MCPKKLYYVPWENASKDGNDLDRLSLQGPHSLEDAEEIASTIRSRGSLASVIDCSTTLEYAEHGRAMFRALENICASAPLRGLPLALEKDIQTACYLLTKLRGLK